MNSAVKQAVSWSLIAAACRGMGQMWSAQEELLAAARNAEEADSAAAPLLAVCATCPIVAECGTWAAVDGYSGIAAGRVWTEGRHRKLGRRRRGHAR